MSYKVAYANPDVITQAGFGQVARLPFIFDSKLAYHRSGSQFLIDRGLGVWNPKHHGTQHSEFPPSEASMKSYAERLANILEWCEKRGLDPINIDYNCHLVGRYQKELITGSWSLKGKPLSERTVNVRIDIAVEYLTWLANKSLRLPFLINSSKTEDTSCDPKARPGRLRDPDEHLIFPDDEKIVAWLKLLYAQKKNGTTIGLIAELILETAIRREEAACWRVDTLPLTRSDWQIVNPKSSTEHQAVSVTLRYGTKGKEFGRDHGDKIGPSGTILVPYPLAEKLHHYREKIRPKALSLATRRGIGLAEQRRIKEETVHLFLKPCNGLRFSGQAIYDAWCSVEHPPHWHPHMGRHFWACTTLWRKLISHQRFVQEFIKKEVNEEILGLININALSIIQLEIQPQLRHVSQQTTLIYLKWVTDRLHTNLNLQEKWVEELSDLESL